MTTTTTVTTYLVAGMSCEHCARAVTAELTRLPGVEAVEVALSDTEPAQVTVSSAAPLDEQAVREAVDEAGYDLVGVAAT
jgi:copper chaperone CopZ